MPDNTDPNLNVGIAGGLTATIATDFVIDIYGATSHVQLTKVVFGGTSDATRVSSSSPLPTYLATTGVTLNTRATITGGGTAGSIQVVNYSTTSLKVNGSGLNNAVVTQDQAGNTLLTNIYTDTQAFSTNLTGGSYKIKAMGISPDGATSGAYVRLFDPSTNLFAGVTNGGGSNALMVQVLGAPISLTANISSTVGVTNSNATALYIQGSTGSPVSITGVTLESLLTTINNSGISGASFAAYIPTINTLLTDGTAKVKVDTFTLPTSFATGLLGITQSIVQFTPGFTCQRGVNIKSLASNTQFLYIGESSGFTNGYPLAQGDEIFLEISNANKFFAKSGGSTGTASQSLYFIAR
jgi:hypothetical protein